MPDVPAPLRTAFADIGALGTTISRRDASATNRCSRATRKRPSTSRSTSDLTVDVGPAEAYCGGTALSWGTATCVAMCWDRVVVTMS